MGYGCHFYWPAGKSSVLIRLRAWQSRCRCATTASTILTPPSPPAVFGLAGASGSVLPYRPPQPIPLRFLPELVIGIPVIRPTFRFAFVTPSAFFHDGRRGMMLSLAITHLHVPQPPSSDRKSLMPVSPLRSMSVGQVPGTITHGEAGLHEVPTNRST